MWNEAQAFLLKDRYISPLIKRWGPCSIKPIRKSRYFEDLVDAICSQQLSGKAAATIFNHVKECLEGKIAPERILSKKDQELRDCGLSWAKVKYVKDLADHVSSNRLKVTTLDKLSDEEVVKELIAVKGIGRWTAEMFLMFSLARPDVFPIDDLGIKKGFEKVVGKRLEGQKLSDFAKTHWAPYRSIASWYIWRSLENK